MEKLQYDPLPAHIEPSESHHSTPEIAREYPLILSTGGRIPFYFHTQYANLPWIRELQHYPRVQIHPDTAGEHGIREGDWVWIESPRGRIRQKANLFGGMDPRQNTSPPSAEPRGLNRIRTYPFGPEIRGERVHRSFVSIACMHSEDAPCIKVCPAPAIYKDAQTRITLVARECCIGWKACLWVCPYGVPSFDGDGKLALCDLYIDRLKEGKKTACEAVCQASAIFVGTPEDIAELHAKGAVERIARGLME